MAPVERLIRTSAYGLITRLTPRRLERLGGRPAGRMALSAARQVFVGGTVTVTGGAAGRLLLDTTHLAFYHPQGYGLVRGVVEPSVQEALRRNVAPGMTVFDVGADIGFFSLLAARLAGPSGRVEAFEPVPASAAAVRANAALNGFGHLTVHNVAVSDHDGTETLLIQTEPTWSHLAERGPHADTRARASTVVISLDREIRAGRLPRPDVVKIDVEGSEGAVLRGLIETLRAHPVVLICELHETNRELLELLAGIEYQVENLDGTQPVGEAGPVHILARPAAT